MLEALAALFIVGGLLGEQCLPASTPPRPTPSHKGTHPMIRAFNAFQLVTLFAAMPFIVGWLHSNPFSYSSAAFWTSVIVYLVMFIFMCIAMFNQMDKD